MKKTGTRSISVVQERAALLLAKGARSREVARQLGVTEQTIGRWRKQDAFTDAVAAAGQGIDATIKAQVESSASLMLECKNEALDVVRRHLHSDNPSVALKAAELLLKT
jgi:transposase-like protein